MRFLLLLLFCTAPAVASSSGPAARLQTELPALFPVGSVADTMWSGTAAARLVRPSEAARALGLQEDDWILAAEPPAAAPTFTVVRGFAGDLPRLPPALLGRQVLEQFAALPPAQRLPMRLVRMLANQQTLVTQGVGIVLVPEASNRDDAVWQRVANPLPLPSEAALEEVRQAVFARVPLAAAPDGEAAAAARLLAAGDVLEARERAVRAVLESIATPAARQRREDFDAALALYVQATAELQEERREVLSPGPRFAFVLETLFSAAGQPLSQDIVFAVEGSNDFSLATGLNTSLHGPSPSGGGPVLRDLDLLVEYAYTGRDFSGPNGGDEPPPEVVQTRLETAEHRVSLELAYRPRLSSRLRPLLRGGPALFRLSATALDHNGVEHEQVGVTSWGWLAGGGLDLFQHRRTGLRLGLVGTYQRIVHEFCPDEAPNWEAASNIPAFQIRELLRPRRQSCISASNPAGYVYRFDLSAWQAGLTLTLPF